MSDRKDKRPLEPEGVIKFNCRWERARPLAAGEIREINACRARLYRLGLIGETGSGIGYGNLSQRRRGRNGFIITGSGTGRIKRLTPRHYTCVTRCDPGKNLVVCRGPLRASSESLAHSMLYRLDRSIRAVIHAHALPLWKRYRGKYPTTSERAAYGTQAMAREIKRLFPKARRLGALIMGGHTGGILAFGRDFSEAASFFSSISKKK